MMNGTQLYSVAFLASVLTLAGLPLLVAVWDLCSILAGLWARSRRGGGRDIDERPGH